MNRKISRVKYVRKGTYDLFSPTKDKNSPHYGRKKNVKGLYDLLIRGDLSPKLIKDYRIWEDLEEYMHKRLDVRVYF